MNLLCIYTKKYFGYPTNKNDTTQHNLALITARKKNVFQNFETIQIFEIISQNNLR